MERYDEVWKQATQLHLKGKVNEALELYDKMLAHQPDNAHLLACMGTAFCQAGAFGSSIQLLRRSTELNPALADGWHNLGIAYRTMGMIDNAMACYTKELELPGVTQKNMGTIHSNMSGCYVNEGRPERCIEFADKGLRYDPLSPQLRNHKSLALLELGRYREGFELYEARYELPEFTPRDYGKAPRWDGKAVRRLAVHGEQGIGDEILFLTQIKKLLPLCEEVAIECTPRLVGLLRHSYRNEPKIKLYPTHEALQKEYQADAWCGLGSLVLHCWPFQKDAYLEPSRAYFRTERPRLGISWRGGTLRTHEYHRNAPFEYWKPLVDRIKAHGVDVISVQYGPAKDMAQALGIPHDEDNIRDLDMLASMVKSCDHILSVCNTTVHMAGAMNVPTTVLVPNKPAWRYGLRGERSDWYDSVEHFRQAEGEEWGAVLARATKHMEEWANAHQRKLPPAERAKA